MKRLLIDAGAVVPYYVSGKVSGIGRTTMELIQALAMQADELPFEVMLYSQNMKGISGRNMHTPFRCRHLYLPDRPVVNKMLAHTPIKHWFTGYDMVHVPANFAYVHRPDRCIVTIHDAMFFSYPEKFLGHDFARANYPKLAQKARAIITCSENSKREIAYYMHVPEERIFVTPWGVDHDLFKPRPRSNCEFTDGRPFFLSVSCDIGRKNTIAVLEAYKMLIKQNPEHDLILVWGNPPENIKNQYSNYKRKIHFLDRKLDNERLAQLYSDATATFFPSRYEGFGLPILESMASGTPVVTCNNSSLPEVGGDAAIYVDPDDVDGMCKLMEQFENKSVDIEVLQQRSVEQAAKFTWANCAGKTINVYRLCLGE